MEDVVIAELGSHVDADIAIGARDDARFDAIAAEHVAALRRLARGYEIDEARQEDLVQEILLAIWRALPSFEGRSSLRTWVFRVAHNVAVSHVVKRARDRVARAVAIEDADLAALARDAIGEAEGRYRVQRVIAMVRALKPTDAQVFLLYLEGFEPAEIAEVTGLSANNVAVKVFRIKAALRQAFDPGGER